MSDSSHSTRLRLDHINLTLGGNRILSDVSISFRPGLTALIGPNGAGKTSCLNVVSGFAQPQSGKVFLGDRDITNLRPLAISRLGLARTFQSPRVLPYLSVLENVLLGAHGQFSAGHLREIVGARSARDERAALKDRAEREVLDLFGLRAVAANLAGSLPIGTQKVLEVGRALMTRPSVLLLDEPAAGLGAEDARVLVAGLNDYAATSGGAIVMIEHDISLIRRLCPRAAVLNFGTVVASGSIADVMSDPEVIKAYLGVSYASRG